MSQKLKSRNLIMGFIPQIEPWIDDTALTYLKRVIESTYVTEHEFTQEFERRLCELTGAKHAIAVCNGTAALFCCLKALDIGIGDEVIVPNLTFIATANAVLLAGATPVVCDIKRDDLSFDLDKLEGCISSRTKAIMPVHLYGFSADMKSILSLAEKYNIKVIEDAAQGVGVFHKEKHVGTFGDLGILSFYGNKTITCGEGGVILTDDDELREKCYRLKNHGRSKKGVFVHDSIGFNFCFTELQAAVGLSQLDKLPQIIKGKKDIRDGYVRSLSNLRDKLEPLLPQEDTLPVYWFTSFLTPYKAELQKHLSDMDIQTRDFFYPLDMQPCYDNNIVRGSSFEESHALYSFGLSLPSSYMLTWGEQERVIDGIIKFFEK